MIHELEVCINNNISMIKGSPESLRKGDIWMQLDHKAQNPLQQRAIQSLHGVYFATAVWHSLEVCARIKVCTVYC